MSAAPFLAVADLRKHFPLRRGAVVRAVDDVSFEVARGETIGIVGESGCGKSTTARLLLKLIEPDAGEIRIAGEPVVGTDRATLRRLRRRLQIVFQDSHASLNPRLSIVETIAFGPIAHGVARERALARARELLRSVELDPDLFAARYPGELSGGQRQRVNIARALAIEPELVILDEAVSALDKSVEAQVLTLLLALKRDLGLTYIFISHDLNVVQYASDRVIVMYLGKIVESGPVERIYRDPRHPYTQALLASRPTMDPDRRTVAPPLVGDPPDPIDPPSGCRFRTRCASAEPCCAAREPALAATREDASHRVACLLEAPGSGHSRARAAAAP